MLQLITKGGYVIVVIMACSLIACAVIIERWLYYRAADKAAREFRAFLQTATADETANRANSGDSTTLFEKMWDAAVSIPPAEREARQIAVDDAVRAEIPLLERNLYILTTAATVAPLLGLLGTVLGMIKTFQAASMSGLGNPQMLAEGISEALYNTAGGLLVAIPCIIANNHFRSRVERLVHWTEGCVGEIVRRAHA
ncbi:MAG TPA: MotA/TolQ/ExbB proton channel family protein [Negativicutes bacterium]|nr:MotA/TolQ/ExbB proton channel family protein [Negativicutes bacterium]